MSPPSLPSGLDLQPDLTRRLRDWLAGAAPGGDPILDSLGRELADIAGRIMHKQPPGHTLQATALLNEFWMKISQSEANGFRDRRHFMGLAVTTMRCIVVDHAKAKQAEKRAPPGERVALEGVAGALQQRSGVDLVELNDALEVLGEKDPDALKVIEMRFFGGLNRAEAAEVLGWTPHRMRSEELLACKRLERLLS